MRKRARILVLTGPGKGKTTSALGTMLRALGHGKRVLLARFAKTAPSGELDALAAFANLTVIAGDRGMTPSPGHPDYPAHVAAARTLFARVVDLSPDFDLLVLDELCGLVARDMIHETETLEFLARLEPGQAAILTGRGATLGLLAAADTVSEILCLKHAYNRGIPAQPGMEM